MDIGIIYMFLGLFYAVALLFSLIFWLVGYMENIPHYNRGGRNLSLILLSILIIGLSIYHSGLAIPSHDKMQQIRESRCK